jgi:futalosine hydrolase
MGDAGIRDTDPTSGAGGAGMTRILVITAVAAERDAVLVGFDSTVGGMDVGCGQGATPMVEVRQAATGAGAVDCIAGGIGAANAAAVTMAAMRTTHYELVISAGIAGGFPPAGAGTLVVAEAIVHADLGADSPNGFLSASDLGLSSGVKHPEPVLVAQAADRTGALTGAVLTVSTVTGTVERFTELQRRYPTARAEAMEGAGVCAAAVLAGVAVLELRAISNDVGPRDRATWQIGRALEALSAGCNRLFAEPLMAGGDAR